MDCFSPNLLCYPPSPWYHPHHHRQHQHQQHSSSSSSSNHRRNSAGSPLLNLTLHCLVYCVLNKKSLLLPSLPVLLVWNESQNVLLVRLKELCWFKSRQTFVWFTQKTIMKIIAHKRFFLIKFFCLNLFVFFNHYPCCIGLVLINILVESISVALIGDICQFLSFYA